MAGFRTILKLSSEKHLKSFAYTPDNLSKRLYFFCRANSNLDSLACSLDSEIAQIQPGPSGS